MTTSSPNPHKGYRFPAEIISHCVWLYYTFPLSYRDVEKMMLYRGIEVTYDRFGNGVRSSDNNMPIRFDANTLPLPINGIKGEVVVTITKQQYYLWRAVDSEGNVLDVLLQQHRDTQAAKRL